MISKTNLWPYINPMHGINICVRRVICVTSTLLILSGCTVQLEPSYDARIVKEIEILTLETQTFFAQYSDGIPATGYAEREKVYAGLAGRAAAIKIYAEGRPVPSGRVTSFFQNLITPPAPPRLSGSANADRTTGVPEGNRYENATSGYMEDYLRNLKRLVDRDRQKTTTLPNIGAFEAAQSAYQKAIQKYHEVYSDWVTNKGPKPDKLRDPPTPPANSVSKNFLERRQTVLNDVLRDTLLYERDILNRNR